MKLKVIALLTLASLIGVGATFMSSASAQDTETQPKSTSGTRAKKTSKLKVKSDKAQTAAAGTADANVKTEATANNATGEQAPAPPNKGGSRGKGWGPGYVLVTFDNYTPWFTLCYVDGIYRGTVAPWGALTFATGSGATGLYARANFDDGSYKYWGPWLTHYYSGYRYNWRLGL